MADRFFTPRPLGPGSFLLDGPEAHHLATVRRFVAGDRVVLFNGDGNDYPALVLSADRREVLLDVHTGVNPGRELPIRLEVAAALPKGDRGDFLVEKLTELGVTRFTPLVTERSIVLPKDGKVDRLNRQVIEASKQCGRAMLMEVGPPTTWKELLARSDLPTERWVLHPYPPAVNLNGNHMGASDLLVAVGPEGGFTDDEVAPAVVAGWKAVALGTRILRVETAAISLAAWLAVSSLAGRVSEGRP
jgi:16S rRNA (uracil1498-N3)-methyltransferase